MKKCLEKFVKLKVLKFFFRENIFFMEVFFSDKVYFSAESIFFIEKLFSFSDVSYMKRK